MATTVTSYRASTRTFLFFTLHVVETVVSVDGVEAVGAVIGIFPDQASAQAYAQSLPTSTVSD